MKKNTIEHIFTILSRFRLQIFILNLFFIIKYIKSIIKKTLKMTKLLNTNSFLHAYFNVFEKNKSKNIIQKITIKLTIYIHFSKYLLNFFTTIFHLSVKVSLGCPPTLLFFFQFMSLLIQFIYKTNILQNTLKRVTTLIAVI